MENCRSVKKSDPQPDGPRRPISNEYGSPPGCSRTGAFTLLELILIVAILGLLCGIAVPIYADLRYQAQLAAAKGMIREIEANVNLYYYKHEVNGIKPSYPATLADVMHVLPVDPWGNTYRYISSEDPAWYGSQRMDRNMRPLNSDFDLYSMGPDGRSAPSLSVNVSRDDIIRAGNGAFVDEVAVY